MLIFYVELFQKHVEVAMVNSIYKNLNDKFFNLIMGRLPCGIYICSKEKRVYVYLSIVTHFVEDKLLKIKQWYHTI